MAKPLALTRRRQARKSWSREMSQSERWGLVDWTCKQRARMECNNERRNFRNRLNLLWCANWVRNSRFWVFFVSIRVEMSCFGSTSPTKVFYFEKSLRFRVPYSLSGVFWHMHNSPANNLFFVSSWINRRKSAQTNLFLHFHSFRVIKCTQFGKVPRFSHTFD